MEQLDVEALVDRVTARTKGTAGDPLTREEVAHVVRATLNELHGHEAVGPIDEALERQREEAGPEPESQAEKDGRDAGQSGKGSPPTPQAEGP
jgi:hypothetical protein